MKEIEANEKKKKHTERRIENASWKKELFGKFLVAVFILVDFSLRSFSLLLID